MMKDETLNALFRVKVDDMDMLYSIQHNYNFSSYEAGFPAPQQQNPAWQVVHISGNGHVLHIKVLPSICQLPGVDVVDHGAEGVGVHGVDVDLSLPLPSLQPSSEDWRLGAEEIFVNSECL